MRVENTRSGLRADKAPLAIIDCFVLARWKTCCGKAGLAGRRSSEADIAEVVVWILASILQV